MNESGVAVMTLFVRRLRTTYRGGSEKYGNKVGGYMHQVQGVDVAVYMHPCVQHREQDFEGPVWTGLGEDKEGCCNFRAGPHGLDWGGWLDGGPPGIGVFKKIKSGSKKIKSGSKKN